MAQGIETKRKCMRNHEMNIDFFRTESMNTTQGGTANAFIHHSSLHSLFPLPRLSVSPQVGFLRRMASVDVRSPDARSLHGRSLLDAWSFHGTASHGRSLRNARSSPRPLDGRPLLTSPFPASLTRCVCVLSAPRQGGIGFFYGSHTAPAGAFFMRHTFPFLFTFRNRLWYNLPKGIGSVPVSCILRKGEYRHG